MATKRTQSRKVCDDKRRFETRDAAVREIIRLARVLPSTAMLRSFRCRYCRGYHFGDTTDI